jgi:diaminopimelate decarboxylase
VVAGLHVHIGSGADFSHLSTVFDAVASLAVRAGDSLEMISAGGGLPVPYSEQDESLDVSRYAEMWNETRDRIEKELGKKVSHEIEPGRYLVAESGYLVAEIRAIKQMGHLTYYLVDAGFNDLARPVMYGSHHHISLVSDNEKGDLHEVVVGGPLCESGDVFTQKEGGFVVSRKLPHARTGDLLVFHTAGAYGATMSSNYNSKPLCPEIAVMDGKARCIRKRQEISDLFRLEEPFL